MAVLAQPQGRQPTTSHSIDLPQSAVYTGDLIIEVGVSAGPESHSVAPSRHEKWKAHFVSVAQLTDPAGQLLAQDGVPEPSKGRSDR